MEHMPASKCQLSEFYVNPLNLRTERTSTSSKTPLTSSLQNSKQVKGVTCLCECLPVPKVRCGSGHRGSSGRSDNVI